LTVAASSQLDPSEIVSGGSHFRREMCSTLGQQIKVLTKDLDGACESAFESMQPSQSLQKRGQTLGFRVRQHQMLNPRFWMKTASRPGAARLIVKPDQIGDQACQPRIFRAHDLTENLKRSRQRPLRLQKSSDILIKDTQVRECPAELGAAWSGLARLL